MSTPFYFSLFYYRLILKHRKYVSSEITAVPLHMSPSNEANILMTNVFIIKFLPVEKILLAYIYKGVEGHY